MKQTDVSAIIINWNTRDILWEYFRSVCEQTCDAAFEIIEVGNTSSHGSVEMVR